METPIEPARWRRSQIAETFASVRVSASCYRPAEYVRLVAIVEAETALREIQRQIFLADVVVGADDSALEQRPERFHRVCVDESAHVFAPAMIHGFVRKFLPSCEVLIAGVLISRDQFNLAADRFGHKPMESRHIGALNHLADQITLARDRADDRRFTPSARLLLLFVPMAIAVLAADVSFVYLDNSHQLPEVRIVHRGAQTMAHIKSRAVRTGLNRAMD